MTDEESESDEAPKKRRLTMQEKAIYLESDALDALLVVAQQAVPLPAAIGGKPVELFSLNRLWGVALP